MDCEKSGTYPEQPQYHRIYRRDEQQGLGDALQFARYLELVKQRGGTVLFEISGPMLGDAPVDVHHEPGLLLGVVVVHRGDDDEEGVATVAAAQHTVATEDDLVVADLSFISLALVVPSLVAMCNPGRPMVLLVKPQFEAGRAEVSRGKGVIG